MSRPLPESVMVSSVSGNGEKIVWERIFWFLFLIAQSFNIPRISNFGTFLFWYFFIRSWWYLFSSEDFCFKIFDISWKTFVKFFLVWSF